MHSSTILAAVLPALALASPIKPRAGGPAFVPIPANCTVVNPLPHASDYCGHGTVSGWMPSTNFTSLNQIYEFYLEAPTGETVDQQWEGCLEQCNGLDGCVSAFLAYNDPTPAGYYGTPGGVLEIGCQMFSTYLTPLDFTPAPAGQYVSETAGNIYCPA